MKRLVFAILLAFSVALATPSISNSAEKAVLQVYLNTSNKGERFVYLDKGTVFLRVRDLLDMGLVEVPRKASVKIAGEEYVPLNAFSPPVKYSLDESNAELRMTAEPELFKKTTIDYAPKRREGFALLESRSAFINYSLNYTVDEDFQFTSLSTPFELVISSKNYALYSNFTYSQTPETSKFVRALTTLTVDDVQTQTRYSIGDVVATSGPLGSSSMFGGVNVAKNYSLNPYLIKVPGVDVTGILRTPSDVSVYVNDVLMRTERLPAGEFELKNVSYYTAGSGEVSVVVTDAYGKEEKFVMPYYGSSSVLEKGVGEWSYTLGFKREDFGEESFKYRGWGFAGFHRLGLTRTFTLGGLAEVDEDVLNFGPTFTFLMGNYGEVDGGAVYSLRTTESGYGGSLAYLLILRNVSLRLSTRGFSRDYSSLVLAPEDNKPRTESTATIGFNTKHLGSISFTYLKSDFYASTDRERVSVNYNKRIIKDLSFFLTVARTEDDLTREEIFANLVYFIGGNRSMGTSYFTQDGTSSVSAYYQKNPPAGTGIGYRAFVDRRDTVVDTDYNTSASVTYRGNHGIVGVDYIGLGDAASYALNASGALAFTNNRLYLTRPIYDSFAVVRVPRIKGVDVYSSSQPVGRTDRNGELLVPEIPSYADVTLSIDDTDVPADHSISQVNKNITTYYRGGGVAEFDVRKLQAFTGNLFYVEGAERKAAEYFALEIRVGSLLVDTVVGTRGKFYVENLPPGIYPARLFSEEKECRFEFEIPESDEFIVELGELDCVI